MKNPIKKVLFVCTGNTCRSPMAQVMAAQLFGGDFEVASAGIMAMPDEAASIHAVTAMRERQLDLQKHQAQMVTDALIDCADLILTMTPSHKAALSHAQMAKNKIHTLGEYADCNISVSDPYGGTIEVYRTCADEIHELLLKIRDKLMSY